jgi:hypothetical protein
MRVPSESERRDVPRWALWLMAVVCFVPLTRSRVFRLRILDVRRRAHLHGSSVRWRGVAAAKSWRFLFAGSVRPDVESRHSRLRHEHRDDWRLDA